MCIAEKGSSALGRNVCRTSTRDLSAGGELWREVKHTGRQVDGDGIEREGVERRGDG